MTAKRLISLLAVCCATGCFIGHYEFEDEEEASTGVVDDAGINGSSTSGEAESSTGTDESSSDGETGEPDDSLSDVPTYEAVQDVFLSYCTKCHAPGSGVGKGDFNILIDHDSFVSYEPTGSSDRLVAPGLPGRSYLITKIDAAAPSPELGGRMPSVALSDLDPEAFDIVYRWVEGGAP